jgi:hypothetical protein
MAIPSDSFDALNSCRALYLQRLRALLLDSKLLSENAIRAIQDGAGAYFDEIIATENRGSFADEVDGLTSSRITLLSEDDLELGIRLENLSARLFDAIGATLWKIHLRFVTLLHRPTLPQTHNPVGPRGVGNGLLAMFSAAEATSLDKKLALLERIESWLRTNLPAMYNEINDFMEAKGIEAAQPTILTTPDSGAPRSATTAGTEASSGGMTAISSNALLALQKMLGDNAKTDPTAPVTMPTGAVASLLSQAALERLIDRLDELDRRGVFDKLSAQPLGDSPSNESLIPELFSPHDSSPSGQKILRSAELGIPTHATEGIAIDTLAMIFEAMFNDPELPDALKAVISSLQIAVLKVAMKDSSLFTDDQHVVRQVIDTMGELVIGLPLDVSMRHPVCSRLVDIASALRSEQGNEQEAFRTALAQLQSLRNDRQAEMNAAAQAYVPLVDQLDRRDRASRAAREAIEKLLELRPPAMVRDFISRTWRPWLQLVFEEHGGDSREWQDNVGTIETLLWTFQPKADPDQRKALAQRLPGVLQRIKTAMSRTGLPTSAQEKFLDECFTLQTQALRNQGQAATGTNPLDADTLAPSGNTLISDRLAVGDLALDFLDYTHYQPAPMRPQSCKLGDWLEFTAAGGKRQFGRVGHISPESRRVLLCHPENGQAVSIHPSILDRQLRDGLARVCPVPMIFERAATRALNQDTAR